MEPPFSAQFTLQQLVINSLHLLGYQSFDTYKDMKSLLDPSLFKKQLPIRANSKSLDMLLYFLLSKLSPTQVQNNFVFCWPPRTPDMKREFKQECFKLIQKLQYEKILPQNTLVGKSVLDMAQGQRVWKLLKILSDSALYMHIHFDLAKTVPPYPLLDHFLNNPNQASRASVYRMKKSIGMRIQKEMKAFNQIASTASSAQLTWVQYANKLSVKHKSLRNKLEKLRKKRTFSETGLEKLAALDRVPQMEMVKHIWTNIEELYNQSKIRKEQVIKLMRDKERLKISCGGVLRVQDALRVWKNKLGSLKQSFEAPVSSSVSDLLELVTGAIGEHNGQLEVLKETNRGLNELEKRLVESISEMKLKRK